MKKISGLILCICLLLTSLLTGCGPKAGQSASDPSSTNDTGHEDEEKGNTSVDLKEQYIDFAVQYIRTDGYIDGEKYPKTIWITSVSELKEYYNANKDKYYLESVEHPYSDQTNRQGTKASAVSTMVVVAGCTPDFDRMKYVELNRPFLYAIVHEDTGLPVFTGILNRL